MLPWINIISVIVVTVQNAIQKFSKDMRNEEFSFIFLSIDFRTTKLKQNKEIKSHELTRKYVKFKLRK